MLVVECVIDGEVILEILTSYLGNSEYIAGKCETISSLQSAHRTTTSTGA